MNSAMHSGGASPSARYLRDFVLCFAGSLAAILVLNWSIDPFSLLTRPGSATKERIAYSVNKRVAIAARIHSKPRSNVIIGDSRAAQIEPDWLGSSDAWVNLAYGGATLIEMQTLIGRLAFDRPPKRILVFLPFNRFDVTAGPNGISEALDLLDRRTAFLLSWTCTQASLEVLLYRLTGYRFERDKPPMARAAFVDFQLRREAAQRWTPESLEAAGSMVKQIAESASKASIDLIFVAPPAHWRVLDLYSERFSGAHAEFRTLLPRLGHFRDYETHEALAGLNATEEDFKDAFHLSDAKLMHFAKQVKSDLSSLSHPSKSEARY